MQKPTKYDVVAEFNGEVYKGRTRSLKDFIEKMKPEQLLTEIYFTVTRVTRRNRYTSERRLSCLQGKRMYSSDEMTEIFINNLTTI